MQTGFDEPGANARSITGEHSDDVHGDSAAISSER